MRRCTPISLTQLGFWSIGVLAYTGVLLGAPRVVSTSPQITELMFQLGLGDRLTGTPAGSTHPEAAKALEKIGYLFNLNLERILKQKPDWVLWDDSSYQEELDKKIRSMGIGTQKFNLNSPQDVFSSGQQLIELFSPQVESERFQKIKNIWNRARHSCRPFSFIVLVWPDPIILGGEDSFLYRLLEELGGRGLMPAIWNKKYPKVSVEWLISQKPDFVFFLRHLDSDSDWILKKCQSWWPSFGTQCVGLQSDSFARASLTPFESLDVITQEVGGKR